METLATIAIIGRPNVGKSTLFNAFAGERRAIVSDISGTTRDSLIEKVSGEKFDFFLVDTAGLTDTKGDSLEKEIQKQVAVAIEHADLLLFLVDGKVELTLDDYQIAEKMRKSKIPVIFTANKIDDGDDSRTWNLATLGLGMPFPISAKNFGGIPDLLDLIEERLEKLKFEPKVEEEAIPEMEELGEEGETVSERPEDKIVNIALVGRPNVGKSSLLNALCGKKRSVVSAVAGTTRDIIDVEIQDSEKNKFLLLDTAGLRRPGKLGREMEFWGSVRTERAIDRADVCVLLIDALDGVTHQDLAIAGKILDAGKGIILCVNKFDLAIEKSRGKMETDERELDDVKMWNEKIEKIRDNYLYYLSKKIHFLPWVPVLFVSAKTGKDISEILVSSLSVAQERRKRIGTSELNRLLPEIFYGSVQPSVGLKQGKFKYASQVDVKPPKFIFHVNNKEAFHFSYLRYIENKLREKFGFYGTPIKLELRDSMSTWRGGKRKRSNRKAAPLDEGNEE